MVQQKNNFLKQIATGFLIVVLLLATVSSNASASPITSRKVTIGSSVASASTTYEFTFTVPSATVLQSASFTACTTASGACTTPGSFSVASSTLTAQPTNLGDAAGWTVNTATAGSLRLKKTGNAAAPTGAQTVSFSNVVNPAATNSTFFLRMTTYSDDAWATPVDTGNVAASTAGQITITASVDEALTFTLTAATVPLGVLTTSSTGSGTSAMTASTNATNGYSITIAGVTLGGPASITALASPTASTMNTKQFGLNLKANTTPSVGSEVSGTGSGTAQTGYNTQDQYKFVTGDTVAAASAPTNSNTFTSSYIANIDGSTPAGAYSTVLTYVASANF